MRKSFLLAALLLTIPVSSFAQVSTANTSTYLGSNRWSWKIYVQADNATLNRIDCVEYTLHETFRNPVRRICGQPATGFALEAQGWGTFVVNVRVMYRDKRVQTLQHQLVFRQQQTTPSPNVQLTPENWSKQKEPGWWEWGVRIRGSAANLDKIRCVEYTLHSSFPNPVRTICTRQNSFELRTSGWGTFTIPIKILFRDNTVLQVSHTLRFGG